MNKKAFTVIEVLVAVTILSIILISVMQIYISSTDINLKTDINRALQQNIKAAIETIAEDVRKNGVSGVKADINDTDCSGVSNFQGKSGSQLCIGSNNYYLESKDSAGNYSIANNSDCDEFINECRLVKNGKPITNSWIHVNNITFKVSDMEGLKKVTVLMSVQPSHKKGIKPQLIKQNIFDFQTTIVERPFLN